MTSVLDEKVLVLNKSWRPISITTVRKAFVLMYVDSAHAVQPQTFQAFDFESWLDASEFAQKSMSRYVQCSNTRIAAPEIIVLQNYNGFKSRRVKFNRRNIFLRDRNVCQYCGNKFRSQELTLDHVVPRSKGGKATWENIVLACCECNTRKGNRSPEQAGLSLIRRPGQPRWEELSIRTQSGSVPASWAAFFSEMYWLTELKE